jgi:hypothetical protein
MEKRPVRNDSRAISMPSVPPPPATPGAAESSAPERPATARTRRYRERLRAGAVMVPIAVTPEILGLLIDTGWLSESESEDRRQIAAALGAMLADAATARRRRGIPLRP